MNLAWVLRTTIPYFPVLCQIFIDFFKFFFYSLDNVCQKFCQNIESQTKIWKNLKKSFKIREILTKCKSSTQDRIQIQDSYQTLFLREPGVFLEVMRSTVHFIGECLSDSRGKKALNLA